MMMKELSMCRAAGPVAAGPRWFSFGLLLAAIVLPGCARAPRPPFHSTVAFRNDAGQAALVKLIGPSKRAVAVPKNESRTESAVAPGRYYIVVRYGDQEKNYSYRKGDRFKVEESKTGYSEISITLYTVANGNYASRPVSKVAFERALSE